MSEMELKAQIRLALGRRPNVRLFNNPCGQGWIGKATRLHDGAMLIAGPQRVVYGLAPGSADLIGWRQVVITPDMVGQTIAQFVSQEIKALNGRTTPEQHTWRQVVTAAGACAGVVRSVDEALAMVAGR